MNNNDKYPRITPEQRDHLPHEVATEHLCNPRGKLSAPFRRACRAARETVYTSQFPHRLATDGPNLFPRQSFVFTHDMEGSIAASVVRKGCFRVYDTARAPKTAEQRFGAKLRALAWGKLHQIAARCDRRSDKMFAASQKAAGNEKLSPAVREKVAEHFQAQSTKFDFLMGLTNTEINRRVALCKTK